MAPFQKEFKRMRIRSYGLVPTESEHILDIILTPWVRRGAGSGVLPHLQANKSTYSCVVDVHRRYKLPGSETIDFITHSTASISSTCFHWSPWPPKSHECEATWTLMDTVHTAYPSHAWGILSMETPLLLNSKQTCLLFAWWEKWPYVKGLPASNTTLRTGLGKEPPEPLCPPIRKCKSSRDPSMAGYLSQSNS